MFITHLNGACEIIISNGVKILTDPWLVDGEYYGSWYTYPPVDDFDFSDLDLGFRILGFWSLSNRYFFNLLSSRYVIIYTAF